jgi:hypothetical protein
MARGLKNRLRHYLRAVNFKQSVTAHKLAAPQLDELGLHAYARRTIFPKASLRIRVNLAARKVKSPLKCKLHYTVIIQYEFHLIIGINFKLC